MGKARLALGVLLVTLVTGAMGYTIASAVLTYQDLGFGPRSTLPISRRTTGRSSIRRPEDFAQLIHLIIGSFAAAGLMLSLALSGSALTRFGQTHWQTRARDEGQRVLRGARDRVHPRQAGAARLSRATYICSKSFPHALIVAPTGRGKTTGFRHSEPADLARLRRDARCEGRVFRSLGPAQRRPRRQGLSLCPHRLGGQAHASLQPASAHLRIERSRRASRWSCSYWRRSFCRAIMTGCRASSKAGSISSWRPGFWPSSASAGRPLGEIYRIAASGGNKQKEYLARSHEVNNASARLIFTRLASTNNDTLTSYVSLLMTSGLDQWQNPAIDDATAVSDFDFRTIRKKPFSVYLVVQPLMVKPLAPLIRLFFSDLLSALQDKDPGPDEPWPVMIMLDEFNRLGKMPIVAESIEVLRHYRGHLAVVTQTIPAIDEIYGENTRRALQGNAGIKLYLTPSDEKTVEELSKAVGKTTKTVVSRSRAVGKNPFEGRSQSERTEEVSLLPEDEARRLPLDEIVVVVDAQMPVRAKRVVYYEDPFFKGIHAAQEGELPFPKSPVPPMGTLPLSVQAMPTAPRGSGLTERDFEARMGITEPGGNGPIDPRSTAEVRQARAAVLADDQRQFEMDFGGPADLMVDTPSENAVEQVEDALGDLEAIGGGPAS